MSTVLTTGPAFCVKAPRPASVILRILWATNGAGYRYDLERNGSTSPVAPNPQNSGRGPLSSAVAGERLYVLNGNSSGDAVMQIYDATSDKWNTGRSLSGYLYEAAAVVADGRLVIFFGAAPTIRTARATQGDGT